MKNVLFLLPKAVLKPTSLFSSIEVFEMANQYGEIKSDNELYDVSIGGINASQALLDSKLEIKTNPINRSSSRI